MTVRAVLTEYGQPVDHRASVTSELRRPDGTMTLVTLTEGEPGVFEGVVSAVQSGVYHFRVLATGITWRGAPFTREKLLTGVAYPGGNAPFPTGGRPGDCGQSLCHLLKCLIASGALRSFLEAHGLNEKVVLANLARCCDQPPTKEELARREGTLPMPASDLASVVAELEAKGLLAKLLDALGGSTS